VEHQHQKSKRNRKLLQGRGSGGGKGNSLWPSRGSVNHGEDVGLSLRGRKRANNINVDVGKKTTRRNWNGNWRKEQMDMDF
jgi:hypothetical protein